MIGGLSKEMAEKAVYVISEEETDKRIERASRKSKRTSILLAILSLVIGVVLGMVVPRYAKPAAELWVGLMLAGIAGCTVGFWLGRVSKRGSKAERLFMLAMQEENQGRKHKLLGEIVDKYPNTEWVDKALDERVKNGVMETGQGSAKTSEKNPPSGILGENKPEIDVWKDAQRLRDEGFSIRAIAQRLGVPKSTIFDHTVGSNRHHTHHLKLGQKGPLK